MTDAGAGDARLYVPVVTLSTEGSVKLSKQLGEGFRRPVCWSKYKVIDNSVVEIAAANLLIQTNT